MNEMLQHTACVPGDVILVRRSSKVGIGPHGQARGADGGTLAFQWNGKGRGRHCDECAEEVNLHRDEYSGCAMRSMGGDPLDGYDAWFRSKGSPDWCIFK